VVQGRRGFIKALFLVGAVLSIVPFVPWGQYLSSSVSAKVEPTLQKVVADINPTNGGASGKPINTKDLETFPPNSSWLVTYPSSGDLTLDSQNPDTFVKWRVIRLPEELGGTNTDATAFVAFSEVCVHLWCSPNYDPEHSTSKADETFQCPCHGSIYRIPDGLSTAGPASLQPPPTNAIPMLTLASDSSGQLYIEPAVFDVNHNGVIGYGRYYDSYYKYIKPASSQSPSP
jgi:rieske iron-sulfur protein